MKREESKPGYLLPLVAATMVYLLVECAFNSALLDIASTNNDKSVIDGIEFWGRIISGCAVALAICGNAVLPSLRKRNESILVYITECVLICVPIILIVYKAEHLLVETLVENSTPQERKTAGLLSLASKLLKTKDAIELKNLEIKKDLFTKPEEKTFVALFSPLAEDIPGIQKIILTQISPLIKNDILSRIGTAENAYEKIYIPSVNSFKKLFTGYQSITQEYYKRYSDIPNIAEDRWSEYIKHLQEKRLRPDKVPAYAYSDVRFHLKSNGIPIPDNWQPQDKRTFIKVCQEELARRYESEVRQSLSKICPFLASLPLNINNLNSFLEHPNTLSEWKKMINAPQYSKLKDDMSLMEFKSLVYIPMYTHLETLGTEIFYDEDLTFGSKGKNEEFGKNAYRALIVPTLALLFSLIGIIVHLCKFTYYFSLCFFNNNKKLIVTIALFFSFLLAFPFSVRTNLNTNQFYSSILANGAVQHPYKYTAVKWISNGQIYIYPVTHWIKSRIFKNLNFHLMTLF